MNPESRIRIEEVDGIRGWAALCVIAFHLSWETFGILVPQFRFWPTKFFLDGPLAVYVFFILSGDALSYRYMLTGNASGLTKSIIKRYFRLTIPIATSCLIVYLLMKSGLTWNGIAAPIVHREDWLGKFIQFAPNFGSLVRYAFIEVYVHHTLENSYNPFLWTMSIEMIGSLLVFSYLITFKQQKNPLATALVCAAFLTYFDTLFSLFFIGIAFAILRIKGYFDRIHAAKMTQSGTLLILAGIAATDAFAGHTNHQSMHLSIFMATTVVAAIYLNSTLTKFMRTGFSVWLGKISFPLYVLHFTIIVSLTSWLIVKLHSGNQLNMHNIVFVIVVSLLSALVLAHFASIAEQRYLTWLNNFVNNKVLTSQDAASRYE